MLTDVAILAAYRGLYEHQAEMTKHLLDRFDLALIQARETHTLDEIAAVLGWRNNRTTRHLQAARRRQRIDGPGSGGGLRRHPTAEDSDATSSL